MSGGEGRRAISEHVRRVCLSVCLSVRSQHVHVAVADDRLSARATDDLPNCLHLRQRALSSILRFHKQSPSISQPLAELQTRTDA